MDGLKLSAHQSASPSRTIVDVGGVQIGRDFVIVAGPCAVETEHQTLDAARAVKAAGADILRGGAFKPRTSPYAFQGLEEEGLDILRKAKRLTGLPVVTEVMDTRHVELVAECADLLQVGSRNMQNYTLLKELARARRPVLLKRGMNATLGEWLNCAEYLLSGGNPDVVLCERGIRTTETYTRNTLDLSIVPAIREVSHLPVIVDPSHATGRASLVRPMSMAAAAAGADGVMIEVHPSPPQALCDRDQQLTPDAFARLAPDVRGLVAFMSQEDCADRGHGRGAALRPLVETMPS
jgi:3-deoxy-7-phosphoheptulonate synthase